MNKTRHTRSFKAHTADGTEIIIDEYSTTVIGPTDLAGNTPRVPGLAGYKTRDGRRVNHISKGKYEIVDVPMIPISTDDPKAP